MSALSNISRLEYCVELGNALPPPALDNPEYRERRLKTAIETFDALRPGDAYEARLAVQIVLTGAHAAESLREAGLFRDDFAKRTRCRAQAASMMREERSTRRMLAQEQKVRLATEAVADTTPMQPAAPSAPPEPHAASPSVQSADAALLTEADPPVVTQLCPAAASSVPAQAEAAPALPPSPEAIEQAEAFAKKNMVAAAQIRHDRGVTPCNQAYFRYLALPTDPVVIDALVRGTGMILTLLDEVGGEELDAAA